MILVLLVATVSVVFAIKTKTKEKSSVFAKYATGVEFESGKDRFKLMPGVFAKTQKTQSSKTNTAKSGSSIKSLGKKGNLEIYVKEDIVPNKTASSTASTSATIAPTSNDKMVVYNTRTKNAGIVMGTIIVKYTDSSDIDSLRANYPIKLLSNIKSLSYAIFAPDNIVDIFSITDNLKKETTIKSAKVEILENLNTAH